MFESFLMSQVYEELLRIADVHVRSLSSFLVDTLGFVCAARLDEHLREQCIAVAEDGCEVLDVTSGYELGTEQVSLLIRLHILYGDESSNSSCTLAMVDFYKFPAVESRVRVGLSLDTQSFDFGAQIDFAKEFISIEAVLAADISWYVDERIGIKC